MLLLPRRLEQFELQDHARGLLQIPRVVALEPGRVRTPSFMRDVAAMRQAKKVRLPGIPRLIVLYHPMQYQLARALGARYEQSELWYVRPDPDSLRDEPGCPRQEQLDFDVAAQERATRVVVSGTDEVLAAQTASLRDRLSELGVISHRPFVPGGRVGGR
ncbi:MAG: hypothetical protein JO342_02215 [Solirubrobacterales bacterium]|nr:hypothetical protein [Solirubrobacterales bacterium]